MLPRRLFNTLARLFGAAGACGQTPPAPIDYDKLPFRHLVTTGANALAEWRRLRALGDGYPIIVGGDDNLCRLIESYTLRKPNDPTAILRRAQRTEHQQVKATNVAAWAAEMKAYAKEHGRYWDPLGAGVDDLRMGEWPQEESRKGEDFGPTLVHAFPRAKLLDRVHILVIPAKRGWEVPAYLNWGYDDPCPATSTLVAALRDWEGRYGAELVGLSYDVMELRVKRRPADRDEAVRLAFEQYEICPDIVDQGTAGIIGLASALMNSDWWYFWWRYEYDL